MIYNGKKILAVALAVGIAMSVPAVNGNEDETELDNATMELMLGLNPGEYPITHGSLSQDTIQPITYSTPTISQISVFEINVPVTKKANQVEDTEITAAPISSAKQVQILSIQIIAVSAISALTPMDIIVPTIITQHQNSPISIYWDNVVMVNETSPMERILVFIQTAISEQESFSINAGSTKPTTAATTVSIPVETIQAANFIDSLTIATYSPPKIKISDIPTDIYVNTTHLAGYATGIEFYQHTIQRIQEGASLIDIYMETVEATGEESPVSIFWKAQIFNAMSEAVDITPPTITALHPATTFNPNIPWIFQFHFVQQNQLTNTVAILPTTKIKQIEILSKYDIYAMCADWGSPISELAKVILRKKKAGLDTSKEEAKFDRMLKLEIEYTKRITNRRKARR